MNIPRSRFGVGYIFSGGINDLFRLQLIMSTGYSLLLRGPVHCPFPGRFCMHGYDEEVGPGATTPPGHAYNNSQHSLLCVSVDTPFSLPRIVHVLATSRPTCRRPQSHTTAQYSTAPRGRIHHPFRFHYICHFRCRRA